MDTDNTRTSVFGRVSLRLVVATVFLSFALFVTGVALFVAQTTGAQSSLPTISFHEITPVREGQTAVIMVSISEPLPTSLPLTLTLVREGSTATRDEDYILTPGGVKINAGETSAEIAVPTIFDIENSYYEGDETVVLELRVNENKVEFATPKQRTLTITDALPAPTLELDDKVLRRGGVRVDYIEEGDQTSSVVVDLNGIALDYDLPVSLNVVGGTVDPDRVTIAIFDDVGRRTNGGVVAQVSVVNNNRYEGEQTVIFELSAPGSGLEITTARREFTIRDDELPPTLAFDPIGEFGEIKEGEEFTATVRLDTALSVPVFVTLMSEQGGTAGMDELEWNPESVEIPAGKRTAKFTLRPVDDEIDERGEGFVLRPSASIPDPGVPGGVRALDSTPFMAVIVDNDPPPGVSLSGVTYVKEGKSRVITAELDRASDETITVTLTADPSSTTDEQDYTPRLPLSRTIAPGDLTTQFTFSSIDDGLYEGAEDERLVLLTSARGDRGELTRVSGGVLPIRDGQLPPTVSFNPIPDFSEGEQREVEVRLSGRMDEPLTLDLIPAGSAVHLRDYTLSEQSITIPAGSLTESVTLSAADVDGNKLIQLSLSTTNEQVDLGAADFAVTILDDDGSAVPTVSLEPITGVNEGDPGLLTVRLDKAATEQLVISPRTVPGGSAESTDYVEPTGNIVIAAGQLSANFQFNTTEDQVYEGDETLILELEVVEGNVKLGTVRRTLTIVEDDDVPNLEVEAAIGIDEGTSREVTIGLTGALEDTVTVSLNMIKLSDRIDSTDYSMLPSALTIVPGTLGVTFTIVTTSDMVYEGDEVFDLELLAIAPTIILGAAVTRITIREDELLPTLILEEVGPIGEGQSRIVIVNLSGPLDIPVMVSLDNVPGGSASEAEVSLSPPRMEIPAGEQSARFLVAISSDIVYELTETVLLRPIGRDLFDNDLSLTTTVSTVLIRDDDPLPSLSLDPVVDIPEGLNRTVQVRLSGPLDVVTNVSLIITPDLGSGINPLSDYQIQERTVAIPPGELEANFVLETNDNSVWQNDKILTLSFDLIDDYFGLQRGVTSREVVIVEDEPVPVLMWDAIEAITEGGVARQIVVTLDRPAGSPVAVSLQVVEVEGQAGLADVELSTVDGLIEPGQLTAEFTLSAIADEVYEGPTEDLTLMLSTDNVIAPNVPTRIVTINEADPRPTLSVIEFPETVTEVHGLHPIRVRLTPALTTALTITFTVNTVSSTAQQGEDFELLQSGLVLAPGQLEGEISLRIIADTESESEEQIVLDINTDNPFVEVLNSPPLTVKISDRPVDSPVLGFVSSEETVLEGQELEVRLDTMGSFGYDLTIDIANSTAGFDFDQDISSVTFAQGDGVLGAEEIVESFPQTFQIMSSTTLIVLTFEVANDKLVEGNESFTLEATSVTSNVNITLNIAEVEVIDYVVTADLSIIGPTEISEGETVTIGVELDLPLTRFLANNLVVQESYQLGTFVGSNFEDISLIAGDEGMFPGSPNNGAYLRELGFGFQFYGETYNTIVVHTNGVIGFTDDANDVLVSGVSVSSDGAFEGDKTPASSDEIVLPIIAPLLSSINYSNPAGLDPAPAFYGVRLGADTADDRYIVQYTNARVRVATGNRVLATFQVVLYANGRIELRYQDIPSSVQQVAKIGISNGTGTGMFDEYSYQESRLSESDTRIVYTSASLVSAVIKDDTGATVTSFDIRDIIAINEVSGTVQFVNRSRADTNWEEDQIYTVELVSETPLVVSTDTADTYSIIDDDLPEVVLEYDMCTSDCDRSVIVEGDSLSLIARLINAPTGAPEAVTVNLDVLGGTTAGSSEYNLPASVTIDRGSSQTRFTVSTAPDDLVELTEELYIGISSLEYGDSQIQSAVSFTLVITDDEQRPTISLDRVRSIIEGETRVVTARLLGAALDFPLPVTLTAMDISATSPDDYVIATATMTIPAGSLTADFEVITLVDQLPEEVETFELSLLVPPETVELDVDATRVVTIIDGVLQVSLSSSKEMALEGQEFEVRLDSMDSSDYDLTIDIATSTAGFDFAQDISSVKFAQGDGVTGPQGIVTSFPRTFQIMNGARSIILTFEVAEDTVIEADEYFTLEATPSVDYVVIDPNSVEIALSDNIVTVGADLSIIGATEIPEGEAVTIGIELDQPLTQSLANNLAVETSYEENVFAGSGFEDISSATGVREFSIVSNSEAYSQELGFGFRFYGETYDTIAVHTNGFIGFTDDPDNLLNSTDDPDGYKGGNTPAIEGEVVPIVAPLLSPINYRNPDSLDPAPAFYGVRVGAGTADDRYIVQYTNVRVRVADGARVPATFQVALYANGRIELRYQDIPSSVQQNAKIGISNGTETGMFDEYSYLESRLSESDTRIVYTSASKVNAVIKDAAGEFVTDFGILDIIAVDGVSGTIQLVNRNREDTNWDGDQTYRVEFVSDSPLVTLTGNVASYTFTDDDLPEITLEYDMCTTVCDRAEVAEGDSLSLIARLTNAPEGAAEDVTVNLEIQGGTATETEDYTLPASVTIAEDTSQTILVFSPIADNLAERTEELVIGISSVEYGENQIQSSASFELLITDNDQRPTISLDPVAPIVEGQTRVVTARLGAPLGFSLTVTLIATDISANSPADYAIATARMTIPAGSVTADFEVVTLVDQLSEELEAFELSLQVPPETVGLDVDATRVVTILEGIHLVNFARSEEVVLEGQEFEVRLDSTGVLGYDLTIDIADSTAGFDFAQDISSVKFAQSGGVLSSQETVTVLPQTFQIMGDTRLIVLTFEVTNDTEIEAVESFTLEATSSKGYIMIDSNTVEVTLSDYVVAVDLSVIGPTDIPEGEAVTIGIELDRPLTQFLTDNLGMGGFYDVETIVGSNFEDISSIAGDPFPATPPNAAYLRALGFDFDFYGTRYSNIAVHTNGFIGFTDDASDLQIPGVNVFSDKFKGDDTPASGDDITLPIVAPLLSAIDPRHHDNIAANDLPNFYGVRLGAGTAEDRYIVQYTKARPAIAPGGSRVAATFQVALYADGRIEFRYQTIPDAAQEAAKIGISNGTGTGMYEEFSYQESLLSDDTRIVYTRPSVDIVIKEADDEAVTSFDIFDIIAVDGVSGTIQLVNRNRADTNWDGDQTYTAELVSTSPLIVSTGTVAPYRFTDDDLPEVTLEYDMCTTVCDMAELAEGASLTLIVKLTNASEGAAEAVTVNLEIQGGTATRDSDYTLPTSVTIAEGAAQTILVFSTTDDNLAERAEDLIIGISSVEYGGNQIPSSASFELSITDNDERPTISLDPVAPITEGDTRVVTARLLGAALGFPLEVTLIATDTSASSPTDYDITVPTVTIPAGSLTVDFEIVIVADMSREEAEEFELSLLVPPETVGLDVDATRVVTILDGTPLVGFSRSENTVIEGQELRVQLDSTGSYDYDLTIDIADSTAGFDFAQDITSVTFAQGEGVLGPQEIVTSFPQTFQIMSSTRLIQLTFEVANDTEVEGDESFTLEATSATSDVRITRNIVEVDVIDYVVAADLSVIGPTDIAEGEAVTIGIELDRPLTQFLADNLAIDTAYEENVFAGSNFEDISSATGVHNFSVDDANGVELRELGFGFQFYTEIYNTIVVHTNGVIGFTDDANDILIEGVNVFSDGYRGDKTPANGEGTVLPIVAPLLSSINYFDPGNLDPVPAFYGARLGAGTDEDRYIVQYTNARVRVAAGVRVPTTFQVALYANGRIEFRYQDIPSEVQQVAKIGISNGEGTNMYEEFSYTESRLSESDTRIVYTPSSRVNAVIKDAAGETVTEFGILDIIAVDEVSGTIQLVNPDREDAYWLGDQTYTAELVSTSPLVVSTGTVATYRFTDANLPEVTLEYDMCTTVCDMAEVAEGDSLSLIARLTNAPEGAAEAVTVNLDVLGGTATENLDYTLPDSITIAEGTSQTILVFSTTDDNLAEGPENLTIGFSSVEYGDNRLQSSVRFELLIIDNEEQTQITVNSIPPVSEGETIVVEVVLTPASAEDVVVTLDVADTGDAEPTDYTLPDSLIATIAAGDTTAIFRIGTTGNDDLYEGTETIDFEFTALDVTAVATALIRDTDDAPTVAFETSRPVTVAEGSNVEILVVLDGALAESDIVVDYTVSGTADEGVDYSSLGRSVTIPSGETGTIISIFTVDDQLTEGAETLELRLLSASSGVNVATPAVVDVTIMDDDIVTIGFALNGYYVAENSGLQEIEIEVTGGTLAEALTVAVTTVAGTATAPDDYADTRQEIMLSATDTRGSISIPIELDSLIESTESFEVVLSLLENSPLSDVIVFDPMTATVSISDEVTVGFIDGPYEVNEASGTVELTVGIVGEGTLDTDVTLAVNYVTSDITARAGEDYQAQSGTIVLVAGTNSRVISIPITDDSDPENEESFEVSLLLGDTSLALSSFEFPLDPDFATVTIIDDDVQVVPEPPEVVVVTATLRVSELSVSEGDTTTLNIDLSEPDE